MLTQALKNGAVLPVTVAAVLGTAGLLSGVPSCQTQTRA
jgi:hypothetical protein